MSGARIPRLRHAAIRTAAFPSRALSTVHPEPQTLSLPDSRTLAWASYGAPTGFPVLYLHGYPSSRLEPGPAARLAARHNLRLIAPDRPGFGMSSPDPARKIASYPADLRALTQHLGLSRFAVLGLSGGGPYAVACAHAALGLPRDQLAAVGVFAGAPPWEAGLQHVDWSRRALDMLSRNVPGLLTLATDGLVGATRYLLGTAWARAKLEAWLDDVARKEREKQKNDDLDEPLSPSDRRELLIGPLLEAFNQGSGAAVQEARLLSGPWGFDFADVDYKNVVVWHGAKDTNAPIEMIRWMADRIPHCTLNEYPDDTHYTIGRRLDYILGEFITDDVRRSQ